MTLEQTGVVGTESGNATTDDDAVAGTIVHDSSDDEIADELLIEEISIDGMCGVY